MPCYASILSCCIILHGLVLCCEDSKARCHEALATHTAVLLAHSSKSQDKPQASTLKSPDP